MMMAMKSCLFVAMISGCLAMDRSARASLLERPIDTELAGRRILQRVEPQRPGWMQEHRAHAIAVVRVQLRPDGSVAEILCIESSGTGVDLNDWNLKVADAVREWRFEPGIAAKATVGLQLEARRL